MSVEALLARCRARGMTLAVAEGDTGGLLLQVLTAHSGSSAVVLGGIVAYHDALKQRILQVEPDLLHNHGAVSKEVAEAMACGVRELTGANLGLATTGIAGPGGATLRKPVGLAYVACSTAQRTLSRGHCWTSDRAGNRLASANAAVELALEIMDK